MEDVLEEGAAVLSAIARQIGATREDLRTSPDFRRYLLRRGDESVVVDLVRERAPQVAGDKLEIAGIRVDPLREIFANKLCALLGRAEIRDLVDARALEENGLDLEEAVAAGERKDGGLSPAQLAWVLSQITVGDDAQPPGGVSVAGLRNYLAGLVDRLSRLGFPNR